VTAGDSLYRVDLTHGHDVPPTAQQPQQRPSSPASPRAGALSPACTLLCRWPNGELRDLCLLSGGARLLLRYIEQPDDDDAAAVLFVVDAHTGHRTRLTAVPNCLNVYHTEALTGSGGADNPTARAMRV
jgi:hypothetical protein